MLYSSDGHAVSVRLSCTGTQSSVEVQTTGKCYSPLMAAWVVGVTHL